MAERWDANHDGWQGNDSTTPRIARGSEPTRIPRRGVTSLGTPRPPSDSLPYAIFADSTSASSPTQVTANGRPRRSQEPLVGKVLGSFRNTYYDFPSEADFSGEKVTLFNGTCKPVVEVARGFFETLCVQGSGLLQSGAPVSFNRRDCECATVCPRTNQRICFDTLDIARFPWGRGATGAAITPLLTVAVDTDVIPLNTPLFIPEYQGLPRDPERQSLHDGCFLAQDRGLRVKGKHIDVFTGQPRMTALWNGLVPSNQGVTVVLDSPRCARDR